MLLLPAGCTDDPSSHYLNVSGDSTMIVAFAVFIGTVQGLDNGTSPLQSHKTSAYADVM